MLDESGVIMVGSRVKSGDILVGKVTPKNSSSTPSAEEKLLRTIFGDKASQVKETSLRVKSGHEGVVIDVQIFVRDKENEDERFKKIQKENLNKVRNDFDEQIRVVSKYTKNKVCNLLNNGILSRKFEKLDKGVKIDKNFIKDFYIDKLEKIKITDNKINAQVEVLIDSFYNKKEQFNKAYNDYKEKTEEEVQLSPGVNKMIKVYVATKRTLEVGDKMAGRHGNKGVVSYIAPVEDMPYLGDGTPIDIILNPLGVPSRMNVGQVLETHLGWATKVLGEKISDVLDKNLSTINKVKKIRSILDKIYNTTGIEEDFSKFNDGEIINLAINLRDGIPISTPVFDGASEENIKKILKLAKLPENGQISLYDGRSGEVFDRKITVGYKYMLKLNHLVDEKMHARSIGPYSLITQQPLSGKSYFGGQRFGEMEVWALQAYGASHTLREMLTIKADDVNGRNKIYKRIVEDDSTLDVESPESFNVLVKEIRSLGLDFELEKDNKEI